MHFVSGEGSAPHALQQSCNTPTGFTFSPDAKLQQVMAFAHGFTARVCCSMDSGGSEGGFNRSIMWRTGLLCPVVMSQVC